MTDNQQHQDLDKLDEEITKLEAERTVTNVRLAALDLELKNLKARRDSIAKDIDGSKK